MSLPKQLTDEWEVGPILSILRNGCYYCANCGEVSNSQGSGHYDWKNNVWECKTKESQS